METNIKSIFLLVIGGVPGLGKSFLSKKIIMEYKVYKENNYTIHAIKTDKFRNCVMEIIFTQEIDKKKTTSRTFLNDLLCFTSEKYKTRRELTIELENLYSSYVRCNSFRYGNRAFTSFYTSFLDLFPLIVCEPIEFINIVGK